MLPNKNIIGIFTVKNSNTLMSGLNYKKIQFIKMHSAQQYIEQYQKLSKNHSQKSNQQLIAIESSEGAWQIAKDLIFIPNYHIHGCQLLNRKLSRPYTQAMEIKLGLVDFVLNLPKLNNLLYYVLAKICIHLSWQTIDLRKFNTPLDVINVLKLLPQASSQITLATHSIKEDNERTRADKIFKNNKKILVQLFNSGIPAMKQNVIECLENYVTEGFKLESQELVRLILTRPLSQTKDILQSVLLCENYQNLHNQIFSYLAKAEQDCPPEQFLTVFVAFCRCINLFTLPDQLLKQILQKILVTLSKQNSLSHQQRKKYSLISDSFELWNDLSDKLVKANQEGNTSSQVLIIKQAFFYLWKIVVQRSLLYKMPVFKEIDEDTLNLVINIDDDDDKQQMEADIPDDLQNKFRNTSEEFLIIIYQGLYKSQQHKNKCLDFVQNLTKSNQILALELAIFCLSCIVDIAGQASMQKISNMIVLITKNQNCRNPYIWQQCLKLLGKLSQQGVCHEAIFQTTILILKQSIVINNLAILASETLNQILETCNNSLYKQKQKPLLEELFEFIYSNIYFTTKNKPVFERLTKSFILFIYYFKNNVTDFMNYLTVMKSKVQSLGSNEQKCQILESLAFSHNYALSEYSLSFTSTLGEFFYYFMPIFISQAQTLPSKKIGNLFGKLSLIIGTVGGFNTKKWVQGIKQISKIPSVMQQKSYLLNLCNKLMEISLNHTDPQYNAAIEELISQVNGFVINSLINADSKDFKIINRGLKFQFIVLSRYMQLLGSYNPDPLLAFICEKIFQGFLKYQSESTKLSLAIVRNVMEKKYKVQQLLQKTLKIYPKIVDEMWRSLQAILVQAYKQGGAQIYEKVFSRVWPSILPPNPLFNSIIEALHSNNNKEIKNLLRCIR